MMANSKVLRGLVLVSVLGAHACESVSFVPADDGGPSGEIESAVEMPAEMGFQSATMREPDCTSGAAAGSECGGSEPTGTAVSPDADPEAPSTAACVAGARQPCGAAAVGACTRAEQVCGDDRAWGPCTASVEPSDEGCDPLGVDEDCDGAVDEGCECGEDERRTCGTTEEGECTTGEQACLASGEWGPCEGAVEPQPEVCDSEMRDEDCNGQSNEGCACPAGATQGCGASGAGTCQFGQQVCDDAGNWGPCEGAVEPVDEACTPIGLDEDCDSTVDEGCGCVPGEQKQCGSSEAGTCAFGTQTCGDDREWGPCAGAIEPRMETCDAARLDEDCDGQRNEVCACDQGDTEDCGASDRGECRYGQKTCDSSGRFGPCEGEVGPSRETCDAARTDEDCDGQVNELCLCTNGDTRECGVSSRSPCRKGTETCSGGVWGSCVGKVDPGTETCNNRDDDCNGEVDDGAASAGCAVGQSCESGRCQAVCGDGELARTEECEPGVDNWTSQNCNPSTCERSVYRACSAGCDRGQTCNRASEVCHNTCGDGGGSCASIPGFDVMCLLEHCTVRCFGVRCPTGLRCLSDMNDPLYPLLGGFCVAE